MTKYLFALSVVVLLASAGQTRAQGEPVKPIKPQGVPKAASEEPGSSSDSDRADTNGSSVLDRWTKGSSGKPSNEKGGKKARKRHKGWKILSAGEEVLSSQCEANPASCQCPPGTSKSTYWETPAWTEKAQRKVACMPTACRPGTTLRKRIETASGAVRYQCEEPSK